MKEVEYRVRPVTRYVVTRYESESDENGFGAVGSQVYGEFDNDVLACNAVLAFGNSETIAAQPPDVVVTRRPMVGYEEVRTWRRGEGWSDSPQNDIKQGEGA